jgi:hypothetical protein
LRVAVIVALVTVLLGSTLFLYGGEDNFSSHSHLKTLLIAAVLTAITLALIHNTIPVLATGISQVFSHGALEKSLASFATEDSVVLARCSIATNRTQVLGNGERMIGRINGAAGATSGGTWSL